MEKVPDENRLEIQFRNPLHALLMKKMLGEKTRDHGAQKVWAEAYGKKISDIIDTPAHEDIRSLARAGEYREAAEIVMKILEAEDAIQGS